MDRGFLTTSEAAELCGVHQTTVIRWMEAGRLSGSKTPGGHRRLEKAELAEFMRAHGIPIPEELDCAAAPSGRVRVAVIDDEPRVLKTFVKALEKFPKLFGVTGYESPIRALLEMATDPPDAIVLDIGMPGVDGYEVIRQVRESRDGRLAQVDIVVVTGLELGDVEARALEAGARIVLQKPVDPAQLQEALLVGRLMAVSE